MGLQQGRSALLGAVAREDEVEQCNAESLENNTNSGVFGTVASRVVVKCHKYTCARRSCT